MTTKELIAHHKFLQTTVCTPQGLEMGTVEDLFVMTNTQLRQHIEFKGSQEERKALDDWLTTQRYKLRAEEERNFSIKVPLRRRMRQKDK